MKKRRILGVLAAAMMAFNTLSATVSADWEQSGGSTYYFDEDGEKADGWRIIDGERYFFQEGKAVKSKTRKINGNLYLFGKNGNLLKDGIFTVGKNKYHTDEAGVVTTGQWVKGYKKNYYADYDGKITEYSFKSESRYSKTERYLYINGKKAKFDDIPHDGDSGFDYYIIGERIYYLYSREYSNNIIANDTYYTPYDEEILFDIGKGESLGKFYFKNCDFNWDYCYFNEATVTNTEHSNYGFKIKNGKIKPLVDAPDNISTAASTNKVKLTWTDVKGADTYNVYIYDNENGGYKLYKNVKTEYCNITKLEKNTKYTFKVESVVKYNGENIPQNISKKVSCTTASKNQADGWKTENGEKYYYSGNVMVKSTTKNIDGKLYLFGKTGKMLKGGLYSVAGNKYYVDKDGVVTTNKWVAVNKKHTYYYATSSGKMDVYEFRYEKKSKYSSNNDYILYINDRRATKKDFPYVGEFNIGTYRINNGYYDIYVGDDYASLSVSVYFTKAYDIRTGKLVNNFIGSSATHKNGIITDGTAFDTMSGCKYTFGANNTVKSKTKVNTAFFIYSVYVKKGALSNVRHLDIAGYNNTNKRIKYITYTVRFKNAVGDIVYCDITGDSSFRLKETGPIEAYSSSGENAYWEYVIWDNNADYATVTNVYIEYMDGTTKSYSGSNIPML